MNAGTFVLKTISSLEHSFPDRSLPGTFVPGTVCFLELSFMRMNKP